MKYIRAVGCVCSVLLLITIATYTPQYGEKIRENSIICSSNAKPHHKETLFQQYGLTDLRLLARLKTPRPHFKILMLPDVTQTVPEYLADKEIKWSMIIFIKSDYRKYLQRDGIRNSWGRIQWINGVRMHVVFVIAVPETPEDDAKLQAERTANGDLLQVDIEEIYRNVGLKVMATMYWMSEHFPDDWLYFSGDDDILPDLEKLAQRMQVLIDEARKKGSLVKSLPIYCPLHYYREPVVFRNGKWKVTLTDYPHKVYPAMCAGGFYGLTVKLTRAIYNASRLYPYFSIDDVFLTGFMRLAVCDLYGDQFEFDNSDPSCAISNITHWNFKHIHLSTEIYMKRWKQNERRMLAKGAKISIGISSQ